MAELGSCEGADPLSLRASTFGMPTLSDAETDELLRTAREHLAAGRHAVAAVLTQRATNELSRRETADLASLGDAMAEQIEARWSGPGGCDCAVCSAAAAWRAGRQADGEA